MKGKVRPNMRLKFNVTDLLGTLETRKDELLKENEKQQKLYDAKLEALRPKIVKALEQATEAARQGDLPEFENYSNSLRLEIELATKLPEQPTQHSLNSINYAIAALKRTSSDTVTLSPEEAAWYTGDDGE